MSVNQILETAAGWAGGPPMLILLVGTHLYLTVRLRFIQRYLGHAIRISLQRGSEGAGDVSHFGALTPALVILGWSYYGEKAVEYLFGRKAIAPYRYLWVLGVRLGSVVSLQAVWNFADLANALMAVPNLISLIALAPVLVAETKTHLWELKD